MIQAHQLQSLVDASREFSEATGDLDQLLQTIARRLGQLVGTMCAIRTVSLDGEWVEGTNAAWHQDPAKVEATRETLASIRQRVGEGISGKVASTGKPLLVPHVNQADLLAANEPRYHPYLELLQVASLLMVPLRCRGTIVGIAILVRSGPGEPLDQEDLLFVESISDHAALAIGNARSYAAERAARAAAEREADARRHAESRFERLSEAGIVGIIVSDLTGRISQVNDALLRMVGYSREETLSGSMAWKALTPPEWAEVDAAAIAQLTLSGVAGLRQKEYFHRDGRRVPVLAGSAMLEGASGECISFVLDLTELRSAQVAAEDLRQQREADARIVALFEQKANLAAIVDASDDAIIGKTLTGIITSWNRGAERLFGYLAEELIGQSITRLIPPGREDEEQTILKTIARGEVLRFDTVRQRRDGTQIDVAVTSSPVFDNAGQVVAISKVARDITERKRAEVALARAKDVAEIASRELEAFSYSVAHDLRAPLRGMNGFAQLLLEGYQDRLDDEGRDWLQEIVQNAKKMGELIDALLSLARVNRGEPHYESVDLAAMARTIATELTAASPGRATEWVIPRELRVCADATLARALLDNLLGNAWKFTAKAPSPRIELGQTETSRGSALFVRDNGAGFDMAYANKLFAPFQRLHAAKDFPGTGIGLATVQRIVRRHGGQVWVEAAVGQGAAFYFSFPERSSGVTT